MVLTSSYPRPSIDGLIIWAEMSMIGAARISTAKNRLISTRACANSAIYQGDYESARKPRMGDFSSTSTDASRQEPWTFTI
jgi:hypothetical protein